MDRAEELFNVMLDKYDPELILGALDEMSRMSKEQLIELRNRCEVMNKAKNLKTTNQINGRWLISFIYLI